MTEQEIREAICEVGHKLWQLGFVAANDGNISARLPDGNFITTPTGTSKAMLTPDMLIKMNADNEVVEPARLPGYKPTSEFKVHLRCYAARPEVNAVVHAHPPTATGFAIAHIPLDDYTMPEAIIFLGSVPIAPYDTPGSVGVADSIVPFSFLGFGLTLLFTRNITRAVSLLMVDYSCAIKLSAPIAVISALREAADQSITVKGGKYLEAFAAADTIVFDKTGTLTNAEPVLDKVIPFGSYTEEEVLRTAACIEEHFPHSMARAIVKGAEKRGVVHAEEHAEVNYIVAHGIATTLRGERAVIGSRHFVCDDEGVTITSEQQAKIDETAGASSVIFLAVGGSLAGVLCIIDPPRPEAARAVALMKKCGIENVVMLTGDSSSAAEKIAQQLGITEVHAQVLPEDKHSHIEALKKQGRCVIMVGDGINDAPALAAADVSVAMSDASDIAKETADITIRDAELTELAVLRMLSERLMERINSNYRFILTFNTALLALGFFGVITPSMSALLHNGSTIAICVKSMTPLLRGDDKAM